MKNLVFFDVDGTLSTRRGKEYFVPGSTIRALQLLKEKGSLCFINSGRTMFEMDNVILGLKTDGYVCGCGTYISYNNEVLFSKTIPGALANEIVRDLTLCNLEWILEGESNVYFSNQPSKTEIGRFKKELMEEFSLPCSVIAPEDAHGLVFDKFCICTLPGSDFEYFSNKYSSHFTIIDRGGGFFEIVPKGYSKASGIQFLMDYFNVPLENTYAVGDSTNDLSMIRFAGTGIAVGGSPANVIKYADYVTDPVLEDGIYNAMEHFQLI